VLEALATPFPSEVLVESIVAAKVKALESGIEESLRSHLCTALKVESQDSYKPMISTI
jgi:hypothetical protein